MLFVNMVYKKESKWSVLNMLINQLLSNAIAIYIQSGDMETRLDACQILSRERQIKRTGDLKPVA